MTSRSWPEVAEVSLLLTDIEDSTRLWEQHPDLMSIALVRQETLVADAIGSHGGRLVRNRGEGDSAFAIFERPAAALDAALAVQDALGRESWPGRLPLRTRVGLHVGPVQLRGDDCYGPTVNLAARLRGVAIGGQVVCSGAFVQAVGPAAHERIAFRDLGRQALRGVRQPERVLLISPAVAPRAQTAAPVGREPMAPVAALPRFLRPKVGSVLVGRSAELAHLRRLWQQTVGGDASSVVVSGEAGIGKSRLIAELSAEVAAGGGVVLGAQCLERMLLPYEPITALVEQALDHLGEEGRSAIGVVVDELRRFIPGLAGIDLAEPAPADPELAGYLLYRAVRTLLVELAASRPVLGVVEDLQQMDVATLVVLEHLAFGEPLPGVMLVGTVRDTDLLADGALAGRLDDLDSRHGARIRLGGLSLEDSARLWIAEAGPPRLGSTAAEVHRRTGGNPFFTIETARHAMESSGQHEASAVPSSVRGVLRRRIGRLPEHTREVLRASSVFGASILPGLLAVALGTDEREVLDGLTPAIDARLLDREAEQARAIAFAHALVQEVLYDDLTEDRRRGLHRRIAEAIESRPEGISDHDLASLARHWALVGDRPDRARHYARQAAAIAERAQAFADAAELSELALRSCPPDGPTADERLDLLVQAANQRSLAGDDPAVVRLATEAWEQALRSGDADAAAISAVQLARFIDDERASARLSQVRGRDLDDGVRVLVLTMYAWRLRWFGGDEDPVEIVEEAVALASESTDPLAQMVALGARFDLTPIDRTVRQHLDDTEAALDLIPALADDRERRVGLTAVLGADPVRTVWKNRRMALLEAGRLDEADLATVGYEAAGEEVQTPRHRAGNRQWAAVRELLRGNFDAAEQIGAEAPALQPNAPEFALGYYTQLFAIRKEQGRLHELRGATDVRIESMAPVSAGALAAEIEAASGHIAEARDLVHALVPRLGTVSRNWQWLPTLALLADACALTGDRPTAVPILEALEPQGDRVIVLDGSTLCWGSVARFTAPLHDLLGDEATAEDRHRQALEVHGRMAAVPLRVRDELGLARLLLRRDPGDLEAAFLAKVAIRDARRIGQRGALADFVDVVEAVGG